jgi:hypothetical protein
VAVLEVQVLPGQAPAPLAEMAGVLDSVCSAWGAVAYDEDVLLVRWGPASFVLLMPNEAGGCSRCAHMCMPGGQVNGTGARASAASRLP